MKKEKTYYDYVKKYINAKEELEYQRYIRRIKFIKELNEWIVSNKKEDTDIE